MDDSRSRFVAHAGARRSTTRPPVCCALVLACVTVTSASSSLQTSPAVVQPAAKKPGPAGSADDAALARLDPGVRSRITEAIERASATPTADAIGDVGDVFHAFELFDRASQWYARARALEPKNARWTYSLAVVEAASGNAAPAADLFRQTLALKPGDLPARLRLADLLLGEGRIDESRRLYEGILADSPRTAQAEFGLGRTFAESGDQPAAIEHYLRAVTIAPEFGAAQYALAQAYSRRGERDEAERRLALYRQHPRNQPPVDDPVLALVASRRQSPFEDLSRAKQLMAQGRYADAIGLLERAVATSPDLVQVYVNLVAAYSATGAAGKAEAAYRSAAALNADLPENHYNFGLLCLSQGRRAEAITHFERALAGNAAYADAHNNLGFVLAEDGRTSEAMEHFRAALVASPGHRDASFNLGRLLVTSGQAAAAVPFLTTAAATEDEKTSLYLYYLGDAYARKGALADAERCAREARRRAVTYNQTSLVQRIDEDLKRLESARKPQ